MGIGATGLYNTFGDKRALFIKVLERYVDCSVRARLKRLESSLPPKEAVQTLIEDVVERSVTDRARGGCLLINSALEIAPHDPQLADRGPFLRRGPRAASRTTARCSRLHPR
jgi:TetR/AcrR family transcriptional repressor of nem operon